jgi:small conductance mechanosensitive channel
VKRRLLLLVVAPLIAIVALSALAIGLLQAARIDELQLFQSLAGAEPLPEWVIDTYGFLRVPLRMAFVAVVFILAWLVTRVSRRLAGWLLRIARYEGFRPPTAPPLVFDAVLEKAPLSPVERRHHTVQLLVASLINAAAFVVAFILAAGQFVSLINLAVVSTIVANAFGFAARDFIGDMLNGLSNIFEDRFDVGDNISVFRVGDSVEGIVERVTVRTLSIRTRSGDLIIVPQGEVRTLRNYSRGSFSGASITVRVPASDLPAAMAVLLTLADEAPMLLPDLLEPWKVVSQDGTLGDAAEILIHTRARYGHGAGLRLRIMTLVSDRLALAGVSLAS